MRPEITTDDAVELTVPADPAFVSVLRAVAASLAAGQDFTIDEIDDLRIAVDEASALLIDHAMPRRLAARFSGGPTGIRVDVSVPLASPTSATRPAQSSEDPLDRRSFAWLVLSSLSDELDTESSPAQLSISLTKKRNPRHR